MPERTTVRLPDELVRRAKRKAARQRRTLTALIEEGLRRVLDERAAHDVARSVSPPISSATGGLMPGIDLDNSVFLQEMDDLEYLRWF